MLAVMSVFRSGWTQQMCSVPAAVVDTLENAGVIRPDGEMYVLTASDADSITRIQSFVERHWPFPSLSAEAATVLEQLGLLVSRVPALFTRV